MILFLSVFLLAIIRLVRNEECLTLGDVRDKNLILTDELLASYTQICLLSKGILEWNFICADNVGEGAWTNDNGHVWCRKRNRPLGDINVGSATTIMHGQGKLKLANVNCNRTEDGDILACNHTLTNDSCKYLHGVKCDFCYNDSMCNAPGYCDTVEDTCECNSNCLNEGFCDIGKCICRYPYYGDSCEMKQCDLQCVNNGTCTTSSGTCNCMLPFYGDSCQFKMCPNQCSGKGTCNNRNGTCECVPPYWGDSCQSQNCVPACSTNATCNTNDGTCRCNSPYYGDTCKRKGTNCSITCLNEGSCNYELGTCQCQGSFKGEQCEISQPINNELIYIGITVSAILVVFSITILAVLVCLLCVKLRMKNSPRSKNTSTIEHADLETISGIEHNGRSRRKLKVNKAYSKIISANSTDKEINLSNGQRLNEIRNVSNSLIPIRPSTDKIQDDSYTELGIVHKFINEGEEIYNLYLNGEKPDENIYELYSRINDSPLPSKNASIVLSQEERNSIQLQDNEPIYETCIRRVVQKSKDEDLTKTFEYCEPPDNLPKIFDRMSHMRFREINPDTLTKQTPLGSGEFGVVYKGRWDTGNETIDVAIKTLKSSEEDIKTAFMREAAIMGQFNHPNILKLMGILSLSEPFMIVTELMKCDLPPILINLKPSGIKLSNILPILLKFCKEIALGMEYLASRNCVHRDLAARNVLLNKNMVCKISDFGMSREYKEEYDYYRCSGGLIPVKWTAPEAIFYKKYTEKSDVWAFGMTMYEIWTLGYKPWHDKTNEEIINKMQALEVLDPPTGCPKEIYDIMLETWNYNVEERVTFSQLRQLLEKPIVFQTKTADLLGNDPSLFRRIN